MAEAGFELTAHHAALEMLYEPSALDHSATCLDGIHLKLIWRYNRNFNIGLPRDKQKQKTYHILEFYLPKNINVY